jgi:cyanophycinase-like exopeptidase
VHVGFSLNLLDTYSNGRLLATIESVWTEQDRGRTVLGLEAGAAIGGVGLVARVGSGRQPGLAGGLLSNTTFGASLLLGRARLDYAFQRRSAIGRDVHLAGIRWTP